MEQPVAQPAAEPVAQPDAQAALNKERFRLERVPVWDLAHPVSWREVFAEARANGTKALLASPPAGRFDPVRQNPCTRRNAAGRTYCVPFFYVLGCPGVS